MAVDRWVVGTGMLVGLAIGASALLGVAPASADTPAVPQSVGMLPASEAPPPERGSPIPIILEAGGAVLLAGGVLVVARSWVSTEQPV